MKKTITITLTVWEHNQIKAAAEARRISMSILHRVAIREILSMPAEKLDSAIASLPDEPS